MRDLATELRNYVDSVDESFDPATLIQKAEGVTVLSSQRRPSFRQGVVIGIAAAIIVLVLVGGALLAVGPFSGDQTPVVTQPNPEPTVTQPTSETTLPPPSSIVPSSVVPVSPTTSMMTATTLPTPTTLAPYEGEVPDLGTGWVRQVTGDFHAAAANPELGMAAFGNGKAWHSPDGVTWTQATGYEPAWGDPPQGIDRVEGNSGGFVAIGPGGDNAFHSVDGMVWEPIAPPNAATAGVVVGGAPGFVVFDDGCSDNPITAFSADGRQWQSVGLPASCYGSGAAWTGDHFVAVSSLSSGAVNALLTSEDGVTWDRQEAPTVGLIGMWGVHVAGQGESLVLLGNDPIEYPQPLAAWYSNDGGTTWSESAIEVPEAAPLGDYQIWRLIHSDLGYVAVGGIEDLTRNPPGFILWSPDGATWFEFIMDDSWFRDVEFIDGKLIGLSGSGVWIWTDE